jgi:FkbM family methyltransferase
MQYRGLTVYYRKGVHEAGSDRDAITEVLEKKQYADKTLGDHGFDVEPGERWLDLGANIGAFAVYCRSRKATAVCYEPDPSCFEILRKNAPEFKCFRKAVTAQHAKTLEFRISNNPENHWRGTVCQNVPSRYIQADLVDNLFVGKIANEKFDGIKIDIEGSEGEIFDAKLLPHSRKLVLEYHTSRDSSVANLKRRLAFLRERFDEVRCAADMEEAIAGAATFQPKFDQLIFAWSNR